MDDRVHDLVRRRARRELREAQAATLAGRVALAGWDESSHPRTAAGGPGGGEFAGTGTGPGVHILVRDVGKLRAGTRIAVDHALLGNLQGKVLDGEFKGKLAMVPPTHVVPTAATAKAHAEQLAATPPPTAAGDAAR